MRELLKGHELEEDDVQDILYSPDVNSLPDDKAQRKRLMVTTLREKSAFITMVKTIITSNEVDERVREREHREHTRADQ